MIGTMVIWITFGIALISVWSYYHVATAKRDSLKLARGAFHATVVGAVLSSLLFHVNVDMTTKESSIAIAVHRDGQ
jgi:hypothetical protein